MVSRLIENFESASADTAGGNKKKAPPSASSARRNNRLPLSTQKSRSGKGLGVPRVSEMEKEDMEDTRASHIKMVTSNSAQPTPRAKMSLPAAGGARSKTAPLASNRSPLEQPEKHTKPPSLREPGAKRQQQQEEQKQRQQQKDRKKREVRARRKTKERARRRLRNFAANELRAVNEKSTPAEKKGDIIQDPRENSGGTGEIDDRLAVERDEFPSLILRPTAPATSSQDRAVPDEASARDGCFETNGQYEEDSWGSENEVEAQGRQEDCQGRPSFASGNGANTENSKEDFEEDAQHQLLRPIAPREDLGINERMSPERQWDDGEISQVSLARESPKSDYGDEGFEDDAS